ncbi:poly [ADP-ribose] polymerase tankyrase-like isoform X1 [Dermacentor andersoni]|uniref:poly [ADP-ribose] polymerase tankyrase-like isoform X1 n=1 Tax=Dermacentor andersoni TaxID=34620 RepID=UPI002155240B|nr:poly [ADP-ribose] polymerase tankyrase-like isoform X1 [Dermacentor andersoni]XP_050036797.1 poly [ADP-ribose] polymerase tankyrase-like isoform X1 [Dermacentor andersoni]
MEPATNGCKDGPTPLLVQNHSEGTPQQEKKSPEKHGTKAAVTQDAPAVTSRAARHANANSKASSKSGTASAAASTGSKAASAAAPATVGNSEGATPSAGSRRTSRNCAPGPTAGASATAGRAPAKPPPRESSGRRGAAAAASSTVESAAPTSSSPPAAAKEADTTPPPRRARKRESPRSPGSSSDTAGGGGSGRASKRMRLQYQPFQSPGVLPTLVLRTSSPKAPQQEDKVVVFQKGEFLAVRNETGSFYVCRTAQNVYKSSKRFKIQWLNNDSEPDIYAPDFYDNTDFECVLTNLRMRRVDRGRYLLPDEERKRTLNILQRALNVENGMDIPDPRQLTMDGVDVSFVGKEEEEELSEASPPATNFRGRRRTSQKEDIDMEEDEDSDSDTGRRSKGAKGRPVGSRVKLKGKKASKPASSPKWSSSTAPMEALRPNPKVALLEKDPYFESASPEPVPVSTVADSKLLIRAVLLGDHTLLKSYLADQDRMCSLGLVRSVDVRLSALDYSAIREDYHSMRLLLAATQERLAPPPTNILLCEKGPDSYRWLATEPGAPWRLPLIRTEVAKNGNCALLLDSDQYVREYGIDRKHAVQLAIKHGVSFQTVDQLLTGQEPPEELWSHIVEALRHGEITLAGSLAIRAEKHGLSPLHPLFRQVLLNRQQPLLEFQPSAVLQKTLGPYEVTALHCAAVNPEHSYLAHLLSSVPHLEVQDGQGWQPLHYAAVATGTAPLELLLARGTSVHAIDKNGDTPLHKAACAGRSSNLEVLLRFATGAEKGGPFSAVDRPNNEGWTPLHLAVKNGHLEAAQVLMRYKAEPNRARGAPYSQISPLMCAAQEGSCDMVHALVEGTGRRLDEGTVELLDECGRSALTHAVLNGQTAVCAKLLRLGSNPNRADVGGNTLVHYAAAYGWLSCLRLLVEAGAAPHKQNSSKVTPVQVAFLKGHMGVVDYLLDQPGVELNADSPADSSTTGRTLAMRALRSRLSSSVYTRLQFLFERQGSDANKVDQEGNNALHHLVLADSEFRQRQSLEELDLKQPSLDIAHIEAMQARLEKERKEHDHWLERATSFLLGSGCSPTALNKEQLSPLSLALHKGSLLVVQLLVEAGNQPEPAALEASPDFLRQVALFARQRDVLPLLNTLLKPPPPSPEGVKLEEEPRSLRDILRMQANGHDRDGLTPLLVALRTLGELRKPTEEQSGRLHALLRFLLEELGADAAAAVRGMRGGPSALHLAARCPGAAAVDLLLQHKPLLEPPDQDGLTPLARAVASGNSAAVHSLVAAGASVNVDLHDGGPYPVSLLVYAAMNNLPGELIQLLLKHKANPRACNHASGNNALHYVVSHRSNPDLLDTVRALLDAGIDVNSLNLRGRAPLHLAANAHTGMAECSTALEELLLQKGARADAKDTRGRVPLHYAFVKIHRHWDNSPCDPVELATLLQTTQTPLLELQDNFGMTPVHYAAIRGSSMCMHSFCSKVKTVDIKDKANNTPLGLAVLNNHPTCALLLLQKGALPTLDLVIQRNDPPQTGLRWLYVHKKIRAPLQIPILQELVKRSWQGILQHIIEHLELGGKGLALTVEAALKSCSYELALRLIAKVKHGWTLYSDKQTMLHVLAREAPRDAQLEMQIKVAQALMDKGVPVMARDEHGSSVLTYAAMNWNYTLCQFFLDKMGMVAAACADQDHSLRTPFTAAFWKLQSDRLPEDMQSWCLSLLEAGASADLLTCFPLQNLEFPGTTCLTDVTRIHSASPTAARLSPLILAVCKRNYAVVKMLLRAGANINFRDGQQRTALMYAVRLNDIKMAKLLLNASYDPDRDTDPYGDVRRTSFKKTSPVDLTHQDMYGWNVMHHVVAPLANYTFCCPAMLQLLVHVGTPLDAPDSNGVTPLQLAAARGVANITHALQTAMQLSHDQVPKVAVHHLPVAANSKELDKIKLPAHFSEDSKEFLEKVSAEAASNQRDSREAVPDPFANMDDGASGRWTFPTGLAGEVVMDKAQNVPYDALLTMVDLSYGQFGLYSFYKMQLIQRGGLVVLFCRWGRVGDSGQWSRSCYSAVAEAAREFARLFRSKTGNAWEDQQSFKAQPRKFRAVQWEKRKSPPPSNIPISLGDPCKSLLPPAVLDLMRKLANPEMLVSAPLQLGAQGQVALELLSAESLSTALALLEDIHQLVREKASLQASLERSAEQQEGKLQELLSRLVEKSEELYCLVPVRGRRFERLEPLFEERGVSRHADLVHSLVHLHLVHQLLTGAQLRAADIHPLDYVYLHLGCKLFHLGEENPEVQTTLQYVHNSSEKPPKILRMFRLTRDGELERLESCGVDNHWLLWHAVQPYNLLSVLANGLEPRLLVDHWMGDHQTKGICLADRFEQARWLCQSGSMAPGPKYMLLCEVALGRCRDLDLGPSGNTEPGSPGSHESTRALGRWQPHILGTVTWHNSSVPLGPTNKDEPHQSPLNYNEYVVYKPSQVCLRYLLEFED